MAPAAVTETLYPAGTTARLFVSHTRPEPMLGVLAPLATGRSTVALGFTNAGGTLGLEELLFINRCSWAHVIDHAAALLGVTRNAVLSADEIAALDGRRTPAGVITSPPSS